MHSRSPWKSFYYALESYERELNALQYPSVFQPPASRIDAFRRPPENTLSLMQANSLLAPGHLAAPHGIDLLTAQAFPKFPKFPERPNSPPAEWEKWYAERAATLAKKTGEMHQQFQDQQSAETLRLDELRKGCLANDPLAVQILFHLAHVRHVLPKPLLRAFDVDIDYLSRIALCTIEVPDFTRLSIVKPRGEAWRRNWTAISKAERKHASEVLLYSLCLRAAYLTAWSDSGNWFDTVAVNARQSWFDPATGAQREGIIASVQAAKEEIRELRLEVVDPKSCFRHLKGISTPSAESVTPIRPIFILNRNDKRIIEERNVADNLAEEANLAVMPWDDFEHLVRQLFEWEFGRNGVEVKVTRASRDRGVDAIMFDPDPLRGGKYVLQAKRYTRPVDVAAVRDLYGTIVNEGANRGILVTTSSYGPDSYEFAKDKPISLVDGPNLLAMLTKHGRRYRIDLAEARHLETSLDEDF